MNKPTLYIDFDNVLTNSTKQLVKFLNIKFNTNKDWRDVKQYDCKDLFPNITHQDILNIFDSKSFFIGLELFPKVNEVLEKYKDDSNYCIPTIGTKNNLLHKQGYLKENLTVPYVFKGIEKNGTGKDMVDMSDGILIDDHMDNHRSSNAKYKILYKGEVDTEWNECKEDNFCFIARNWNEVDEILKYIKIMEK